VALIGDGVLAVTEGVPQLDGAVARAGDDLAVVGGEGDGQDVVGVADEAAGGDTGGELPEAESLVPRGGQSVGTVGGDDLGLLADGPSCCLLPIARCLLLLAMQPPIAVLPGTYAVGDDVRVAVEAPLGVTVRGLVAGQVPDDQGLVAGTGQEHVRAAVVSIRPPSNCICCRIARQLGIRTSRAR